jgi:uncharacterized peroxidase-related enzyme
MRLSVLDNGHSLGSRVMFALIRVFSGHPVVDAVKLLSYRPDFFGKSMKRLTHEAMRGPSAWPVADRELMAACVSHANGTAFCINAHSAVAERAYGSHDKVAAALVNPDTAPLSPALRATLRVLIKLTREHEVSADDMRALLAAGVSRQEIEDALAVGLAFNITDRLADAFGFAVPGPEVFEAGAKFLLERGYR